MSVERIAASLERAPSTVISYLGQLIEAGEAIDVTDLVPADHYRRIADAFAEVGFSAPKPGKEIVGDDISYSEIHLVRAALQRNR